MLLIHGLYGSRSDTLPAMATLNALGFPMLAVTYRNDVGAAPSPDHRSHLGDTEMARHRGRRDYARLNGAQGVVLYGWSLGAGMAVVASEQSSHGKTVRALVLDSPLLDWPAIISSDSRRHGLAPTVLAWATEVMLPVWVGVKLDRYRERRLAAALSTPTLVVHGSADTVVAPAVTDTFARARPDLVTYLKVPGADHVSAVDTNPAAYAAAVGHFLAPLS